ncbi:MAG: hypothetical protein KA105_02885 [Caulobacter sp.]|nr:hypothetical protein [Caulobacter sp.]
MIAALAGLTGLIAICLLGAVALLGWGGALSGRTRLGLLMILAGLCWAAPARFLAEPPGLGDVLFLAGIILYVVDQYGLQVFRALDRLDGRQDGRIFGKKGG